MSHRLTAIDCFAGAGGLSLGLRDAGFDVCAAFDADALAVDTYNGNLGNHALVAKAEDLSGDELLAMAGLSRGECSLVAGGPPCQGFSRQRRGSAKDERNELVHEFFRLVADIHPTFFLMENVAALGSRGAPHLQRLREEARDAGYDVYTDVLDAVDFGVPQRRRRLFVVGVDAELGLRFEFPKRLQSGRPRTVRDAIGDLPEPVRRGNPGYIANHDPDNMSELNRVRISHVPPGGGRDFIPAELRLPCHRADADQIGHRNVYGRLHWDEPAGRITTKCNSFTRGKFAHPEKHRNISMREAARLQSFPDWFAFQGDKVAVAHQVGNAVPPLLGEALGRSIAAAANGVVRPRTSAGATQRQLALELL
jgi:DNA (cytosine-5)-methyltransferase 1